MTSRARQCKSNGIRVNALLGFGFSEPSREPVAAAQHRLGAITGVKKAAPEGVASPQLLGRGSFRLRLKVDAAADIAEVEAVKLQRHVSPGQVDQAERGIVEVLIHSIEVESCRFEILIQGYEPVVHVRTGNLGRKRHTGNVFAGRIMLAAMPKNNVGAAG